MRSKKKHRKGHNIYNLCCQCSDVYGLLLVCIYLSWYVTYAVISGLSSMLRTGSQILDLWSRMLMACSGLQTVLWTTLLSVVWPNWMTVYLRNYSYWLHAIAVDEKWRIESQFYRWSWTIDFLIITTRNEIIPSKLHIGKLINLIVEGPEHLYFACLSVCLSHLRSAGAAERTSNKK